MARQYQRSENGEVTPSESEEGWKRHLRCSRVTISQEAKFLTVSMAAFRGKKQRYAAFFSMFLQLPSTAKEHHYPRRKISQNCYTIGYKR